MFYKYRSISNWKRMKDLLENEKLYASDFQSFNDPMEGYYYHHGLPEETIKKILQEKLQFRICSLSRTSTDAGMWGIYAECGKGCCIEVIPNPNTTSWEGPIDIDYNEDIKEFEDLSEKKGIKAAIEEILSTKLKRWRYEKEVRYYNTSDEFYLPVRITKVILGFNISKHHKQKIMKEIKQLNNTRTQPKQIKVEVIKREQLTY